MVSHPIIQVLVKYTNKELRTRVKSPLCFVTNAIHIDYVWLTIAYGNLVLFMSRAKKEDYRKYFIRIIIM